MLCKCSLLRHVVHLQSEGHDAMKKQWEANEARAAATAEELVAEEAREAAQAAAKKAKKKKAKTRKQQTRSNATSASASPPAASEPVVSELSVSEAAVSGALAESSLQAQKDVDPITTLHHISLSGSTSHGMPPDQDTAGLQAQLQQLTLHDSAMQTLPVHAVLDEEVATSAAADGGLPAGGAAAGVTPQGGHASFLDQLFCCPITKVLTPSNFTTVPTPTFFPPTLTPHCQKGPPPPLCLDIASRYLGMLLL